MKLLKLALKPQTAFPVLALTFASAVSVLLVVARIIWTREWYSAYLVWNLFLAWMPLAFALLAYDEYRQCGARKWRFWAVGAAWLLFFPNAPYIFTDVIHLTTGYFHYFWVDLTLIMLSAVTGLVLGFLSLFLMQSLVIEIAGRLASWGFIVVVASLSAIGIYLGRFLRFNSWDVLLKPIALYHGIGSLALRPTGHLNSVAFPMMFAAFLFVSYLMLYALTHLQLAQSRASVSPAPSGVK
ncbi:MAG: hypothetical protein C5B50_14700 [Verrucomicrobia bacterium]|nr:MAG: hypothetical protein C5B50_14700 [Verrucomicrobiota bacterium]